jgi:cyanate lyase
MNKQAMTEAILGAKKQKGVSWAELGKAAGVAEMFVATACHGEASIGKEGATAICSKLDLAADVAEALQEYPLKGHTAEKTIPTDPLIYRFYEIMTVYGMALKSVIHERFGDGIMSAIDFTIDVEREPNPKGDRVKVVMNGKFLPYVKW